MSARPTGEAGLGAFLFVYGKGWMTTKLELVRGSTVLDLSDNAAYVWEGDDSFGMAPVGNITERAPQQHGATVLGFRLQPRIIQLALVGLADSETARYTRRTQLMSMLAPVPGDFDVGLALRLTLSLIHI